MPYVWHIIDMQYTFITIVHDRYGIYLILLCSMFISRKV